MNIFHHGTRVLVLGSAMTLLVACDKPLDFDMRGKFGDAFNTTDAAHMATAKRPRPDDRGIISYPNYQVAVARRGDTLASVATRVGTDVNALARYNGIKPDDNLREGEIIALPRRVAEPSPATGSPTTGPIQAPGVDITKLAGGAIERAGQQTVETTALAPASVAAPKVQRGIEPTRHKVVRGETAYTISRLYNVTVRSLAEWNGLGSDFAIREGQYLLIPVPNTPAPKTQPAVATTEAPGVGTPTPVPPSATKPLPAEKTVAKATPEPAPAQTKPTGGGKLAYPVGGKIIRDYAKGKNEGIDIAAAAGTAVGAAEAGTVAYVSPAKDDVQIIVVKHKNDLTTVYANIADIAITKGQSVTRGQNLAAIPAGSSSYVHFEVRKGFDSVDPLPYLK